MGMSLVPVREEAMEGRRVWRSVFTTDETTDLMFPDDWRWDDDRGPETNPAYRPELDLSLSNANMVSVMTVLGYEVSDSGALLDLDGFVATATRWLRRNVGRRSDATETTVHKGRRGATMIDFGIREGYINEKIHQAVTIAREGARRGATHISIG